MKKQTALFLLVVLTGSLGGAAIAVRPLPTRTAPVPVTLQDGPGSPVCTPLGCF